MCKYHEDEGRTMTIIFFTFLIFNKDSKIKIKKEPKMNVKITEKKILFFLIFLNGGMK